MDWVDRCEYKQPDRALFPAYKSMGLSFTVTVGGNPNMRKLLLDWFNEGNNYDYISNQCFSNCEHYRQVGCPNTFHF